MENSINKIFVSNSEALNAEKRNDFEDILEFLLNKSNSLIIASYKNRKYSEINSCISQSQDLDKNLENYIKNHEYPKNLFKNLCLFYGSFINLEDDKFLTKCIILYLKHHNLDLESSIMAFESIKTHLESTIKECYERGSLLTSLITNNNIDTTISEYKYFQKYLPSYSKIYEKESLERDHIELEINKEFDELKPLNCNNNKNSRKRNGQNKVKEIKSPADFIFTDNLEVLSQVLYPKKKFRYLEQALDVIEDHDSDLYSRNSAFEQLPSLISVASNRSIDIVFNRVFNILVLEDGNENIVVQGLKELYLKNRSTYYKVVDFFNSPKSTLRTRIIILEFCTKLAEILDCKKLEAISTYFLSTANKTYFNHNFIVHNAMCFLFKLNRRILIQKQDLDREGIL